MWGAELLEALQLSLFRCWINSEHLLVHYITNCGYFSLIFLFNTAIFGVVAWKNCHLWRSGVMQGHCKAWKVALAAMGLFCLLGATWALSFLSYGSSSMPVLFLAAILNSLQGQGQLAVWLGRGGRQEEACLLPDTGGPGVPRHSHALPFSREQRDLPWSPATDAEAWRGTWRSLSHCCCCYDLLPSPAGVFIFIWLVVLYYPRAEETSSSLSHIVRNDRTMAVSQG